MNEVQAFLNTHYEIRNAVLWIDGDAEAGLKELLSYAVLKRLVCTGNVESGSEERLKAVLREAGSPACELQICNMEKLPEIIGGGDGWAFVFLHAKKAEQIVQMSGYGFQWLVGSLAEGNTGNRSSRTAAAELKKQDHGPGAAYTLWKAFRKSCEAIFIVSERGETPEVLSWKASQEQAERSPELSIILPVYNVEKYLPQCIENLARNDGDFFEFVFVSDGSPDGSADLIRSYAEKDERIRLLEKENGGCASARQFGLDRVKGTYVGFVDPDDYTDPGMFERLLAAAMTGSYDISFCGYREYYESSGGVSELPDMLCEPYLSGTQDRNEILRMIYASRVAIWRGIYRREMLEKAEIGFYTDLRRFDDLPFKVEVFAAARSVVAVPFCMYNYRLERPGQDVSADDRRLMVHFDIFRHLDRRILAAKDRRLKDALQLCKIQTHMYGLSRIRKEFAWEYRKRAAKDLRVTGGCVRTFFLALYKTGIRSALASLKIMLGV